MMALIRPVTSVPKTFGTTALLTAAIVISVCTVMSSGCSSGETAYEELRAAMVRTQIQSRGVEDENVLAAMSKVPRHRFVPKELWSMAYIDSPLPIGKKQTISQPYIVALMTESLGLDGGEKVLEIGTGSGYQAAVLAEIADSVFTIEIIPDLADRAAEVLEALGYRNVFVRAGDGYDGWPEEAPFDGIIVTAAAPELPPLLIEQLRLGGRLVIPVGDYFQNLHVYEKTPDGMKQLSSLPVRFVPMTGKIRESKEK
jgi:protein-L-isoaspartate(D-aspartate) O-methyltransferase